MRHVRYYRSQQSAARKPRWIPIAIACAATIGCAALALFLIPRLMPDSRIAAALVGATATPAPTQEPTPAPTPTATPVPTPSPTPTPIPVRRARIQAVGDIMVHDNELAAAQTESGAYDFVPFFEHVQEALSGADMTMANLETVLGGADVGFKGYPRFNTPDTLLDAIRASGIDVLTFSNNHALDQRMPGLRDTLEKVRAAGFPITGAYATQEEADAPAMMLDVQGIRIAILAYTYGTNGMEKSCDINEVAYAIRYLDLERMKADVRQARADGAEFVIVCPHWGEEYTRQPSSRMRTMADELCVAGADAVLASHPHMVQPIVYKQVTREDGTTADALIAYSMGNFISDQRAQYKDTGMIVGFDIVIEDGAVHIENPTYTPTWVMRTSTDGKYDYRVLPISQYKDIDMSDRLPGMRSSDRDRMRKAWDEITALIGEENAAVK